MVANSWCANGVGKKTSTTREGCVRELANLPDCRTGRTEEERDELPNT
jgi:hypothetical protein